MHSKGKIWKDLLKDSHSFNCTKCYKRFKWNNENVHKHICTHQLKQDSKVSNKRSREQLKMHLKKETHSNEKPYYAVKGSRQFKCKQCDRCFKSLCGSVYKHFRSHQTKQEFMCEFCQKHFVNKRLLRKHVEVHEDRYSFKCEFCCIFYNTKRELESQMKQSLVEGRYACFQCTMSYDCSDDLNIHLRSHLFHNNFLNCLNCAILLKSFLCTDTSSVNIVEQDEISFDASKITKEHENIKRGKRKKENDFVLSTGRIFRRESAICGNILSLNQVECDQLKMVTVNSQPLEMDSRQKNVSAIDKSLNPSFNSEICDISDCVELLKVNRQSLDVRKMETRQEKMVAQQEDQHRKSFKRNREYPNKHKFECNVCKKHLESQESLKNHEIDDHSKKKPYKSVDGELPFECTQCGLRFCSDDDFYDHFYTQHMEKEIQLTGYLRQCKELQLAGDSFQCIVCSKSFIVRDELESYIKFHSLVDGKHACYQCNETFVDSIFLKVHLECHWIYDRLLKCTNCVIQRKSVPQSSGSDLNMSKLKGSTEMCPNTSGFAAALQQTNVDLQIYDNNIRTAINSESADRTNECNPCEQISPSEEYMKTCERQVLSKEKSNCIVVGRHPFKCNKYYKSRKGDTTHMKKRSIEIKRRMMRTSIGIAAKTSLNSYFVQKPHQSKHETRVTADNLRLKECVIQNRFVNKRTTLNATTSAADVAEHLMPDADAHQEMQRRNNTVTDIGIEGEADHENILKQKDVERIIHSDNNRQMENKNFDINEQYDTGDENDIATTNLSSDTENYSVQDCTEVMSDDSDHEGNINVDKSIWGVQIAKESLPINRDQQNGSTDHSQLKYLRVNHSQLKYLMENHRQLKYVMVNDIHVKKLVVNTNPIHLSPRQNERSLICNDADIGQNPVLKEKLKSASDVLQLDKRYEIVDGPLPFKCIFCEKCFELVTLVFEHLKTFHFEKGDIWSRFHSSKSRYCVIEGPRPFKCALCSKCYVKRKYVRYHFKNVHMEKEKKFKCEHCGKWFAVQSLLKSHLIMHDKSALSFQCHVCGKGFRSRGKLNAHVRRVHVDGKPYVCGECSRGFKARNHFKRHLKIHLVDRPKFICKVCCKELTTSDGLRRHLKIHSGETNFQCNMCDKRFRTLEQYKIHFRTHSGEKPYACPHCPRHFARQGVVKTHIRTHTGERPFVCNVCGKDFPQIGNLRGHMRGHTGEKPYLCSYCGKSFTLYSNMVTHCAKCKFQE